MPVSANKSRRRSTCIAAVALASVAASLLARQSPPTAGSPSPVAEAPAQPTPRAPLRLPRPTGPFRAGTTIVEMEAGRAEALTAKSGDRRRLVVQLWYPAAKGKCERIAYMDATTSRAVADELPLEFGLAVRHDGCYDAPAAAERDSSSRFPVILFSHGLGATRFSNAALLEELASRGFVVAAIHHPFVSRLVAFGDGTTVAWDEALLDARDGMARLLTTAVDDARAVLTMLDQAGRAHGFVLEGRLALERVGYAGHSFGGTAAIAARAEEPRIAAVANLDGRLTPDTKRPLRLDVPLLVLLNAKSPDAADYAPGPRLHFAQVAGATHTTFTDSPFLARGFGLPIDSRALAPEAGIELTRRAVESFFACSLGGKKARCAELERTLAGAAAPKR